MPHTPASARPDKAGRRAARHGDAPHPPDPLKKPAVPALPAARVLRLARFLLQLLRCQAMPLSLKITMGVGPLAYFFVPGDFIPDASPKTGRLDDLAVLAAACVVALVYDPEARRLACAWFRSRQGADATAESGRHGEEADPPPRRADTSSALTPPGNAVDKPRHFPDK